MPTQDHTAGGDEITPAPWTLPSGPDTKIDGFWPEGLSAAHEHMLTLLRLDKLGVRIWEPVSPDGADDKPLMDGLSDHPADTETPHV